MCWPRTASWLRTSGNNCKAIQTRAQVLANFPQFAQATSFVRHHHERMDGGGYPDHLQDAQIPLGAKIIGVADALDAMATDRPYRPALPLAVVKAEFQPVVVASGTRRLWICCLSCWRMDASCLGPRRRRRRCS